MRDRSRGGRAVACSQALCRSRPLGGFRPRLSSLGEYGLCGTLKPRQLTQVDQFCCDTFAGLPVTDYGAACDWYVRLLGRAADMFPHETEAVWRLTPNSAIYVVQAPERAGSGLLTVAVADLHAHEQRLRGAGLGFVELAAGDAPRRLVLNDLDGNALTFFQDPAQSSP